MRKIVFVGFMIWLGATAALRVGGQFVFRDASSVATVVLLLVSVPLMVLVAQAVLAGARDRALGAIALVAPGMLLDTFTTMWFPRAFPNMRPEVAPVFGGWLLFCNVVVLLTGALWRRAELAAHGEDPTRMSSW